MGVDEALTSGSVGDRLVVLTRKVRSGDGAVWLPLKKRGLIQLPS